MAPPSSVDMDLDGQTRAHWIERSRSIAGPLSVQPGARWAGMHEWSRRTLRDWTLARLDRPRFGRIADLGCGYGDWTAAFAARADDVHACDVAPVFVEQTRARLAAMGHPSYRVACCDLRDYEVPDDVDLVYVGAVLVYLPDPAVLELASRIRRALGRHGVAIVRDWCTYGLGRPTTYTQRGLSVHRSPRQLIELCARAGLRCDEVRAAPWIYAERTSGRFTRWAMHAAWRLATAYRLRTSYTFIFR